MYFYSTEHLIQLFLSLTFFFLFCPLPLLLVLSWTCVSKFFLFFPPNLFHFFPSLAFCYAHCTRSLMETKWTHTHTYTQMTRRQPFFSFPFTHWLSSCISERFFFLSLFLFFSSERTDSHKYKLIGRSAFMHVTIVLLRLYCVLSNWLIVSMYTD